MLHMIQHPVVEKARRTPCQDKGGHAGLDPITCVCGRASTHQRVRTHFHRKSRKKAMWLINESPPDLRRDNNHRPSLAARLISTFKENCH